MEHATHDHNDTLEHLNPTDTSHPKIHPWRKCGRGQHLVREHAVHTHPSKSNPSGKDTICHEHCANNPSGRMNCHLLKLNLSVIPISPIYQDHPHLTC
jgi:hypothetical protein